MSTYNEYLFPEQLAKSDIGFSFGTTGRFPIIKKRVWGTLADAQGFVDDYTTNGRAVPGLILSVIADSDASKNGVYFVQKVGTSETDKGVLVKLAGANATDNDIASAISGLSATTIGGDGAYIKSIKQENGKIVAVSGELSTSNVSYTPDTTNGKITSAATTAHSAITALDIALYQAQSDIAALSDRASTYKEIYLGTASDTVNAKTGEITKGTGTDVTKQSLNYVYQKSDGDYDIVKVDVSKFLSESEFKNGLSTNENGEVSVLIDPSSDSYLTVGANGIKLSGITEAIEAAQLSGITVNNVKATFKDHAASVTIDGTNIGLGDGYTTTTYGASFTGATAVTTSQTLSQAINTVEQTLGKLADEVIANESTTQTAISAVATAAGTVNADGEITYVKDASAKYISNATSLADADSKLDAAIGGVRTDLDTLSGSVTANKVSGENAITATTATTGTTVKLVLDDASDSTTTTGIKLSQSASGLKAELSLDNTAATSGSGVGLAVNNGVVEAKMYWGTF